MTKDDDDGAAMGFVYVGDGIVRADRHGKLPAQSEVSIERGNYVAASDLVDAVNVALCVGQPLLVTGEPGCGKTRLAWSVAAELGLGEPLVFVTRSTSRAQDVLYRYDAVRRFHDIQIRSPRAEDAVLYIHYEALGAAIRAQQRCVVLIDEIDKAPRDFPNDLLHELDRMSFWVPELNQPRSFESAVRPIVIITSNSERQLPLPFLRRCVAHYIEFPSSEQLQRIVRERLSDDIPPPLAEAAIARFEQLRKVNGITKPPGTSEMLAWIHVLALRKTQPAAVREVHLSALPFLHALLKLHEDRQLIANPGPAA